MPHSVANRSRTGENVQGADFARKRLVQSKEYGTQMCCGAFASTFSQVPIVLVGNKCDIPEREVTREQGQALADSFGVPYFESSAKERLNVEESFHELVSSMCFSFQPLPTYSLQVRQVKASRAPSTAPPAGKSAQKEKKKVCSML